MQENSQEKPETAPVLDEKAKDVEANKAMAIIGYILPILFFVPFLSEAKNSKFAIFHANQQLVLLITAIMINVVGTVIPFIGWFIVLPFGLFFLFVMVVVGIINATRGVMKPLPLIGGFELIK